MTIKRTQPSSVPQPVKTESRICFGIVWFVTEHDANVFDRYITERGHAYNGGFFHGMPCGRDRAFDYIDDQLGRLYAVTTR